MGTLAGDRSYGLCRADGSGRPALPSNLAGRRRRLVGYRLAEFLETKQVEGAATVVIESPQVVGLPQVALNYREVPAVTSLGKIDGDLIGYTLLDPLADKLLDSRSFHCRGMACTHAP